MHSPADVLNTSFPLLLELHVSLDSLLQVQDGGILYDDHSCNHGNIWEKIHVGGHTQSPRQWERNQGSALLDKVATLAHPGMV